MQHDFRFHQYRDFLQQAREILQAPLKVFTLRRWIGHRTREHLQQVGIHGMSETPEIRAFTSYSHGYDVQYGLYEYEYRSAERTFRLLRWVNEFETENSPLSDLWAIPAEHHAYFYRKVRRWSQERTETPEPLMTSADRDRLWNNTLGFLQRGQDALERFGVSLKRGVLLMGNPGNGKTTACRWLQQEAFRLGYEWKTVSVDDYLGARNDGSTASLFHLSDPGIVLFDDLDHAIKDRETFGGGLDQTTFLSELDGIQMRQGVVYLFTTNAELDDLDPAFRRPGRIDHMIRFSAPDPNLRRRFITERWPHEMVSQLHVQQAVEQTDGLSYAELEEVKKQLVLNYLDSGTWNWEEAWGMFQIRMEEERPRKSIGFVPR